MISFHLVQWHHELVVQMHIGLNVCNDLEHCHSSSGSRSYGFLCCVPFLNTTFFLLLFFVYCSFEHFNRENMKYFWWNELKTLLDQSTKLTYHFSSGSVWFISLFHRNAIGFYFLCSGMKRIVWTFTVFKDAFIRCNIFSVNDIPFIYWVHENTMVALSTVLSKQFLFVCFNWTWSVSFLHNMKKSYGANHFISVQKYHVYCAAEQKSGTFFFFSATFKIQHNELYG